MSCSQQMCSINQTSATDVNIVILLLLQQSHLPRILPKLGITLGIFLGRIVDPSIDAMSVPSPTLSVLTELSLGTGGQAIQCLVELLRLLSDVSDGVGVDEALVKAGVDKTVETGGRD